MRRMKIERTLLALLLLSHIIILSIVAILIYWTLRMNEIRLTQAIEENKRLYATMNSGKSKVTNSGQIQVLGNLGVQ